MEPVCSTQVIGRLHENGCDESRLIFRRDRRMPTLTEGQIDDPLIADGLSHVRIEKPLREVR